MKTINLIKLSLICLFLTSSVSAQDYLSTITYETCECLSKITETEDQEQFNLELGLCIIEASMPYKKELKKDHDIDLENITEDGIRLGELIGIKMAGVCPEEILKMSKGSSPEEYEDMSSFAFGTITKVEKEHFVVFSLKDDTGKTIKLHWLYYINSEIDLETDYPNLVGKRVEIYYYESELFDARINEYKTFNIIEEIIITD